MSGHGAPVRRAARRDVFAFPRASPLSPRHDVATNFSTPITKSRILPSLTRPSLLLRLLQIRVPPALCSFLARLSSARVRDVRALYRGIHSLFVTVNSLRRSSSICQCRSAPRSSDGSRVPRLLAVLLNVGVLTDDSLYERIERITSTVPSICYRYAARVTRCVVSEVGKSRGTTPISARSKVNFVVGD